MRLLHMIEKRRMNESDENCKEKEQNYRIFQKERRLTEDFMLFSELR